MTLLNFYSLFFSYSHITDPGREKYHFFFTLRDSPVDFINVNCWGTENYIENLSKLFRINDIGKFEKDGRLFSEPTSAYVEGFPEIHAFVSHFPQKKFPESRKTETLPFLSMILICDSGGEKPTNPKQAKQ